MDIKKTKWNEPASNTVARPCRSIVSMDNKPSASAEGIE